MSFYMFFYFPLDTRVWPGDGRQQPPQPAAPPPWLPLIPAISPGELNGGAWWPYDMIQEMTLRGSPKSTQPAEWETVT